MNRFVSLLLVALCLAAVSLTQPAQAQQAQWHRGLPYFLNSNTQSSSYGTDVTTSVNSSGTGHLNITATPTNSYPGYSTNGSYSGSVGVYYVWGGGNIMSGMTLTTTQSLEASGTSDGSSNGYSTAGQGTNEAHGDFPHSANWVSNATNTRIDYFASGSTPASVNEIVPLSGSVSASYNGPNTISTIVTADVTFGDPVVTQ